MRLEVSTTVASYEVLDIDAQGRIRQYKYGNQVTTVNNYDVASGKLRGIQASLAGGNAGGVFNHSYEYDSLANLTKRVDSVTGVSEGFGYDGLNRLANYSAVGGTLSAASPNNDVQVMYDVRGNITYKSDVGQYWYDSARPNRMTAVTLSTPAGGKALTGTRLMAYAFDDYLNGAKVIGNTTLGNGNLMYTVSQDTTQGRHTVRWEEYTSFNMPRQIRQASLVNTAAGVSTGATTAATNSGYTCPTGYTLSGTNCISVATTYATVVCAYVMPTTNQCYGPVQLSCPAGQILSDSTCATIAPAAAVYTCPSGYQLSGTQCKVFTNNATTGINSTSSDRTLTFVYGPEHQRVMQVVALSASAPAALKAGAGTTWYFNGEDSQGPYRPS